MIVSTPPPMVLAVAAWSLVSVAGRRKRGARDRTLPDAVGRKLACFAGPFGTLIEPAEIVA